MKWLSVALFMAGTAISWGLYAPVVQIASEKLGSDLRAFLLVGLTYFMVGVLVPTVFIVTNSDPTVRRDADNESTANFGSTGIKWGLAAGFVGAMGAVCMIMALARAGPGTAVYVAPVVFAAVPVANTFAALFWFSPVQTRPPWPFFLGLALVATGALLILMFKPTDLPAAAESEVTTATDADRLD
jgi:drug/metabolite transporter (DMT)-like permease